MKSISQLLLGSALILSLAGCGQTAAKVSDGADAAAGVIGRTVGTTANLDIDLIDNAGQNDFWRIDAKNGKLKISGSSPTAICYAFDRYLREACRSMVTWSGKNLDIPEIWPDCSDSATTPFGLRYFLNVCTFGYTTPYWDWNRWSEEIDWMALHGINMPLASVAAEAVAKRVWMKLGLTSDEADAFFTGPAYLPWHRMGNIDGFDGPLNDGWHESQIALQHKILERMRSLGMEPVAPAFAGFIPPSFLEKHPEIEATRLEWGGFDKKYNACVLSPDSPYFIKIGKMFVEEWEKEFGKATYFLSDSFNEMKLPVDKNDTAGKRKLLAKYGKAVYSSIAAGDSDAVWVTQGWTFGYQHDFWDKESLKALLSEVPDDKMIIVDLGNDYPKWVWHTEQTWKIHDGFYGKRWIYSYVPNFGGKVLPTGDLDMYASGYAEALASPYSGTLAGAGAAPEGLENNEVVYELLADAAWSRNPIDLRKWTENYCLARYGSCDTLMLQAWNLLHKSVYSSLRSYPRFTWQTVTPDKRRVSLHGIDDDFGKAVKLFLQCNAQCGASPLYVDDAVEFASLWLGELADRHYEAALSAKEAGRGEEAALDIEKTVEILSAVDRLLASHPDRSLSKWVGYARAAADNDSLADIYEADAKRLITTWGGFQEDYAARMWSGLVGDYYIPRIEMCFSDSSDSLDRWEENWIGTPWHASVTPYDNPAETAAQLVKRFEN